MFIISFWWRHLHYSLTYRLISDLKVTKYMTIFCCMNLFIDKWIDWLINWWMDCLNISSDSWTCGVTSCSPWRSGRRTSCPPCRSTRRTCRPPCRSGRRTCCPPCRSSRRTSCPPCRNSPRLARAGRCCPEKKPHVFPEILCFFSSSIINCVASLHASRNLFFNAQCKSTVCTVDWFWLLSDNQWRQPNAG